jgi:colanic acid biosynthesis glycosyl transferase WcaI
MHILIVSQYFWPENFRINDLAQGLVERGHRVSVFTGMPNYPSGKLMPGYSLQGPYSETWNNIRIIRAPLIPRGCGGFWPLVFNYLSFLISSTLFCLWRCRGDYDAILVFEPSPVTVGVPARLLSTVKKIPILFWVQDLWPESLSATGAIKSPAILKAVGHLVRWIYKGCAKILIQSEVFYEPVRKLGVPESKIHYFPNSAEAFYRPVEHSVSWNGPKLPDGFRIMFAGNLGYAQSFETMLAAAEQLKSYKDIHWLMVGDGRMKPWLENEIDRRGLRHCFHMMGRYPAESMPDWFAKADAMLVSLRQYPIFALTIPSKIQSYMACGRPILASLDGEGARIVETSGSGIAVPTENPDALAAAVKKLYDMPKAAREDMGAKGLDYFKQYFCRSDLLDQLEIWLKEVTA